MSCGCDDHTGRVCRNHEAMRSAALRSDLYNGEITFLLREILKLMSHMVLPAYRVEHEERMLEDEISRCSLCTPWANPPQYCCIHTPEEEKEPTDGA